MIADALSQLPMDEGVRDKDQVLHELLELSMADRCPIDYRVLADCQVNELKPHVLSKAKTIKIGGNVLRVNKKGRVIVPTSLQGPLLEFYHETLGHPGVVRMCDSLWTNFSWDTLKEDVIDLVKHCDVCQPFKKGQKHYGQVKLTDACTLNPWDQVAVDLAGPYTIKTKNKTLKLTLLTCIDLATRWIEIVRVHEKTAENVALLFDRHWLCQYPRPSKVIHDAGSEFSSEFGELLESLGIEEVITTVKNPRANAKPSA